MRSLCFATNNIHKLEEIRESLQVNVRLVTLKEIGCFEELPETRPTLEGNSLQKAEYVFEKYKVSCFADDTGLEVEALHGEPGVISARYAGEHRDSNDNIDLLLKKLHNNAHRQAKFRTVIALVGLNPSPITFEGIINGVITHERRGTSGFGYDPVFVPDGYEKTFAEMTINEKSQISHRARALKKLQVFLVTHVAAL
jgi:XTP/dITP diphosphohydrolase